MTTASYNTKYTDEVAFLSVIENGEAPIEILTPAQQEIILYMIYEKKQDGRYPGIRKIAEVFKTSPQNVYKRLQLAENVVFGKKETKSHELSLNAQKMLEVIHHIERDPNFLKCLSPKEQNYINAYRLKKAVPVSLREIPEQIDIRSFHIFRKNIFRKFDRAQR